MQQRKWIYVTCCLFKSVAGSSWNQAQERLTLLGNSGWWTTLGLLSLLVLYTYKNVRNPCFLEFSWFSETSGMVPDLFNKNVPEILYIGTMLPVVTWCVANFGHLSKSTFQCNFKCKTYLARYDHPYLIFVKSLPTPSLYMEKWI